MGDAGAESRDIERIPRDDLTREGFRTGRGGRLVATDRTARAAGGVAALRIVLKTFFLGRPLDTEAQETERLSILKALPILSSDALSSVAYGPEAGLAVLVVAGASALLWNVPLAIAIAVLMVIVTTSYRQVVRGYPHGGGSYAVAKDKLGPIFGLVAAAALLFDYVLAVAVSVASGVAAVASAFPVLIPWVVPLCLVGLVLLVLANLRGMREAGTIFAGPTYLFVAAMLLLVMVGLIEAAATHRPPGHYAPRPITEILTPLLILTAFASGASSMTGIEAISNTVPSFRKPESRNAQRTLAILATLLVLLFLGISALDLFYGAEPYSSGKPTVLSQIAGGVFHGPFSFLYYLIQFSTLLVLILAANTSFSGFPRLGAILAHDRYLPMRFGYLGDRLVFSTSVVFLAVVAAILIVAFDANTDSLINLYALGVFTAFTLAQSAMARHWWQSRDQGWRQGLAINGTGALITLLVAVIIIITKTPRGAWIVLVVVPLLILLFRSISRYYRSVEMRLTAAKPRGQAQIRPWVVVPFVRLDRATEVAIAYAGTITNDVRALHLVHRAREGAATKAGWEQHWEGWPGPKPTLVQGLEVRLLVWDGARTLLRALHRLEEDLPGPSPETIGWITTVVLPEWDPGHLVEAAVARPQVAFMKWILYRRPGTVVASLSSPGAGGITNDPVGAELGRPRDTRVAIVPVLRLEAPTMRALDYARETADVVIALHVEAASGLQTEGEDHTQADLQAWQRERGATKLRIVIIESPVRLIVEPVLAYIDTWRRAHPEPICTVVVPELYDARWWAAPLHNHRGLWLKAALLVRRSVAVADVNFHLRYQGMDTLEGSAQGR
ncbi:MAG: APC family permease [bacterium]|nr:APC family permease [bacterium]